MQDETTANLDLGIVIRDDSVFVDLLIFRSVRFNCDGHELDSGSGLGIVQRNVAVNLLIGVIKRVADLLRDLAVAVVFTDFSNINRYFIGVPLAALGWRPDTAAVSSTCRAR